jgi:hypothetical protein
MQPRRVQQRQTAILRLAVRRGLRMAPRRLQRRWCLATMMRRNFLVQRASHPPQSRQLAPMFPVRCREHESRQESRAWRRPRFPPRRRRPPRRRARSVSTTLGVVQDGQAPGQHPYAATPEPRRGDPELRRPVHRQASSECATTPRSVRAPRPRRPSTRGRTQRALRERPTRQAPARHQATCGWYPHQDAACPPPAPRCSSRCMAS